MPESFILTHGSVVLPGGVLRDAAVGVANGCITGVYQSEAELPQGRQLDVGGAYITPGFVDIHQHGGGGADYMDGTPEAFRAIAQVHLRFGTTSLTPTTVTSGIEELRSFFQSYHQVRREGTGGAELLGVHMEGPYFSGVTKGAQPGEYLRNPEPDEVEEILRMADGCLTRWDAAPELPGMEWFAHRLRRENILVSAGHTQATAQQTLQGFEWGFSHITHLYSATTTVRKIGQRVYAGLVEAAYITPEVTVELIADGCHVPRESMLLAYQIKGSDHMVLITDAMRATGTDATTSFIGSRTEGNPVVIEDGVAKLEDRSFFAGSIATCHRALKTAVGYGIPLHEAVKMLTLTPARLAGAESRKGSVAPGKDADLLLLDERLALQAVFLKGRRCA